MFSIFAEQRYYSVYGHTSVTPERNVGRPISGMKWFNTDLRRIGRLHPSGFDVYFV